MHIYLIVSQDYTQAFVYSNLAKAKEKEVEIKGIAFEWIKVWCRPYNVNLSDEDYVFDDTSKPWEMLKLAYRQNHWDARAKYREDTFDYIIASIKDRKGIE